MKKAVKTNIQNWTLYPRRAFSPLPTQIVGRTLKRALDAWIENHDKIYWKFNNDGSLEIGYNHHTIEERERFSYLYDVEEGRPYEKGNKVIL
jgi:hypothetical protein